MFISLFSQFTNMIFKNNLNDKCTDSNNTNTNFTTFLIDFQNSLSVDTFFS